MSNTNNNKKSLMAALLSVNLVSCSLNAIAGNIPAMAKSFPDVALSTIELVTTIPSLTSIVAILFGSLFTSRFGYKRVMLFALMLSGVSASAPIILNNITLILLSRAVFGFGVGLIATVLLSMISALFDGDTRSAMIGLQGSVGGLGSAVEAFVAGLLLSIGWHASFGVYGIAFLIFIVFLRFVPDVADEPDEEKQSVTSHKRGYMGILFVGITMFLSVGIAMFFVVKVATLITTYGYGNVRDGSFAIVCISGGSLISGALYGKIYQKLKGMALLLFYLITAVGFGLGVVAQGFPIICIAAAFVGFGYMAFQPYLQEVAAVKYGYMGSVATTIVLIFQYLGAFAAPYFGVVLNHFSTDLKMQCLIVMSVLLFMSVIAFIVAQRERMDSVL